MPAVTLRLVLAASGLAGCAAACAAPTTVPLLGRDAGDDQERAVLRAKSPRAATLLAEGERLATLGGLPALERAGALFRQAHLVYPDASLPWRRDCETLTLFGPRREAVLACSAALERSHSDATVRALVSALVDGPSPPTVDGPRRGVDGDGEGAREPARPGDDRSGGL